MFGAFYMGWKFGMMVLGALMPFLIIAFVVFVIIVSFIKNPAKGK